MKNVTTALTTLAALACLTVPALAAELPVSLDAPAAPTDPNSAMYTDNQLYNHIATGSSYSKRSGGFTQPTYDPNIYTVDDIMSKMPQVDNVNGASKGDVLQGRTFWGLRDDGTWGLQTGTLHAGADVTGANGQWIITIPYGAYVGGKSFTAIDANLVPANIRSGVMIFGTYGSALPPSGTAVAADVLTGKTFSNATGANISGAMAVQGAETVIIPGASSQAIPVGYHNGSSTVATDAKLVSTNIRGGATIFGVAGTPLVVNTGSVTATAADIAAGKTAYVKGALVTGIRSFSTVPLNDTGAITWGNATSNNQTAAPADFPRQDADYRRGRMIFTKLSAIDGSILSDGATSWGCVRDGITGLIWEEKSTDNTLHGKTFTYTWYNSDTATNGGNTGTAAGSNCGNTLTACNTEAFVNEVNSNNWCGYGDWRLPTISELRSIAKYDGVSPAVNGTYFPETNPDFYWADTPYASDTASAMVLTYNTVAISSYSPKSTAWYVRLVRGGQ